MEPPTLATVPLDDGDLDFIFEDVGNATGHNVYEGSLDSYYSHATRRCHGTTTAAGVPGPGVRTLSDDVTASTNAYFLINAVNSATEGIPGRDNAGNPIPLPTPACGPMP